MNMLQELEKYFKETPREQILKEWEETEEFDKVGITVDDFLKMQEQANGGDTGDNGLHKHVVNHRYFFFYEGEEDGWTFEIDAKDHDEAYEEAYDTHGPQVDDMMCRQLF